MFCAYIVYEMTERLDGFWKFHFTCIPLKKILRPLVFRIIPHLITPRKHLYNLVGLNQKLLTSTGIPPEDAG